MARAPAGGFRLVALDVDGTLKPRVGLVSPRVRAAIARVLAANVEVTIATGRRFAAALPYARDLNLTAPLICFGGALVKSPTGQVVSRTAIGWRLAERAVAAARRRQLAAVIFTDDALYTERLPAGSPFADYLVRSGGQIVDDVLAELVASHAEPCHIAVVSSAASSTDAAAARDLVLDLRAELGDSLVVTSGHPLLAEIDAAGVSKGRALAALAESLGIARAEVLAVGDDWNDISMLEYAGLGIAMGDAPPEVLSVANVVAPGVAEDGVAWALERFILSPNERDKANEKTNGRRPTV